MFNAEESARREKMELANWNVEEMVGYKPLTTLYMDFSKVDHLGVKEIRDLYNSTFSKWKNDYKYLTELVMVLNWKIWEHHLRNDSLVSLYNSLWQKTHRYALNHLKGEEIRYYLMTTD